MADFIARIQVGDKEVTRLSRGCNTPAVCLDGWSGGISVQCNGEKDPGTRGCEPSDEEEFSIRAWKNDPQLGRLPSMEIARIRIIRGGEKPIVKISDALAMQIKFRDQ